MQVRAKLTAAKSSDLSEQDVLDCLTQSHSRKRKLDKIQDFSSVKTEIKEFLKVDLETEEMMKDIRDCNNPYQDEHDLWPEFETCVKKKAGEIDEDVLGIMKHRISS